MAFTRTWNAAYEADPADTDDASGGAEDIRQVKEDVQEREVEDHSWAGDANDGKHKVIQLMEQTSPTAVADHGYLFTKVAETKAELHFKDESSNEIQLTRKGAICGAVPVGSIIAWLGGYFADGSNGTYTKVLGTANTVAAVNTLFNTTGWYVCDGAALNDAASSIWTGAGRYLPNLTDDRFIMGDTTCGGIGGASAMAHTHSVTSNVAVANHSAHTTLVMNALGTHSHSIANTGGTTGLGVDLAQSWLMYQEQDNSWSKIVPDVTTGSAPAYFYLASAITAGTPTFSQNIDAHSAHSVTNNAVTSGAASVTENRPLYLACFYLVRTK